MPEIKQIVVACADYSVRKLELEHDGQANVWIPKDVKETRCGADAPNDEAAEKNLQASLRPNVLQKISDTRFAYGLCGPVTYKIKADETGWRTSTVCSKKEAAPTQESWLASAKEFVGQHPDWTYNDAVFQAVAGEARTAAVKKIERSWMLPKM